MVIDDQIIAGLSEPELKQVVIERLSESFDIRPEVKGTFLVDGSAVIIDFLLHPKPPLIEKGFVDEWIGLEVKQPADKTNKPIRFAWQCITYSQSTFSGRRPPFIILFPSLLYFYEEKERIAAVEIYQFLQKANVGVLHFKRNDQWEMTFGGSVYFRSDRGLGPNPNCALKRYVGSWR